MGKLELRMSAFRDEINAGYQEIQKLLYWVEIYMTEGWLGVPEMAFLYMAAKRCSKGCIVELGSWQGLSTIFLSKGTEAGFKRTVYAIDPHTSTLIHRLNEQEDTFRSFKTTCDIFHLGNVQPLRTYSYEAVKTWEEPIGLLFIDADHEYEPVKQDFEQWYPHILKGGMIIFHDFDKPGVCQVVQQVWESGLVKNRCGVNMTMAFEKS